MIVSLAPHIRFDRALIYVKMGVPFWLTRRGPDGNADQTLHYYELPPILHDWLEADWVYSRNDHGVPSLTVEFTDLVNLRVSKCSPCMLPQFLQSRYPIFGLCRANHPGRFHWLS